MIDPGTQKSVNNPLSQLNNGNTHGSSFVAPPRGEKLTRSRAECDQELLDFLVEKTLQSFMPLAKAVVTRQPLRRGKRRKRTMPSGGVHVEEEK